MKKLHLFTIDFCSKVNRSLKKDRSSILYENYPDEFNILSHNFCKLTKEEQIKVSKELSKNEKFSKELMILVISNSNNYISFDQKKNILANSHPNLKDFLNNQSTHRNNEYTSELVSFLDVLSDLL